MPTLYNQLNLLSGVEVDRILFLSNTRGGLDGNPEDHLIAIGDASINAPGMIALGAAAAVQDSVIADVSRHTAAGKSGTEFDPFYSGYCEYYMTDQGLD